MRLLKEILFVFANVSTEKGILCMHTIHIQKQRCSKQQEPNDENALVERGGELPVCRCQIEIYYLMCRVCVYLRDRDQNLNA